MKEKDKSDNTSKDGNRLSSEMVKVKGNIWIHKSAVAVHRINTKNFFKDNDAIGFTSKANFLTYLRSLNRGQLQALETLFELMNKEVHVDVYTGQRPQEQNMTSTTCKYEIDSMQYESKIMLIDDMHRLLWQYSFSIMKCNVTLKELYDEALSTPTN